ncbi:MAG: type II and III secretion system protein family protein [Stappiaceae bacterium]
MSFKTILGRLALAASIALTSYLAVPLETHASEAFPKTIRVAAGQSVNNKLLRVGIGRSVVIDLGEEVKDILVSNPAIADAVVRSTKRVFVLGVATGQANLVLFGNGGRQLASFDLRVETDTTDIDSIIHRLIPGSHVRAESINGNIVLTGKVKNPIDAKRAEDIAKRFMADKDEKAQVLNMIAAEGDDQVLLKVTVAEVERNVLKQLGINYNVNVGTGNFSVGYVSDMLDVTSGSALSGGFSSGATSISASIEALEQDGVVRTLAEPTLTAISGENASFLVGGEFPIPVASRDNEITVEFKKYGVGLDFTPIVMSSGRISLHIQTEVSELTSDGSINLGGLVLPGLKVRRAESTVELPSGGSLVMAGLLKDSYEQTISGVPGLMQLPILGSLFKSRDYQRNKTELVVFVTPYMVEPQAQSALTRPDKNFQAASDGATIFLNRLNTIYRVSGPNTVGTYHGQFGYIYE